jgi:hypothetical protein
MRYPILLSILLGAASCQSSAPPAASLETSDGSPVILTLNQGETAYVEGIPLTFTSTLSDSRCAVDVVCVWEGDVEVEVVVGPPDSTDGPTHQLILHSTGDRDGEAWGLRVTLLEVRPDPVSTRRIPPEEYVVKVRVEEL